MDPPLLACQRCTRLKIKCSKDTPACAQCEKSSAQCVPTIRVRRSRGRQGGRTSKESKLLARIEKLETLLKPGSAQDLATGPVLANGNLGRATNERSMPPVTITPNNDANLMSTGIYEEESTSTTRSQVLLGSSLFSQLSEELVGIRDILEASPEPYDAQNTGINNGTEDGSPGEAIPSTAIHLFAAAAINDTKMLVPSASDTTYLQTIFEQRVHPVVHAVHLPTFLAGVRSTLLAYGAWSSDRHIAAAHAAALYASIVALTDTECMQRWGVPQAKLQLQWRQGVEQQIAGSNFLISERLETLQALIYYLAATRTFDRLDIPPAPQYGYTGLSIFLIESECAALARVLNFVEPADMERAPTALQYDCNARNEAVSRQEKTLRGYLTVPGGGLEDATAQRLAQTIISCMRLYVVRPLQRHPAMKAPAVAEIDIVGLAVETLNFTLELYRSSHPWIWYIRQFNNWHPLAVLLAELAVSRNDKHPEAWAVAEEAYTELSRTIAEGVGGPLWLPVTKLMRAAEARQKTVPEYTNITGLVQMQESITLEMGDDMASSQNPINMMINAEEEIQPWSYWEAFIGDIAGTDDLFWPLNST
ncbi:hypothetical protein LTR62_008658 [Meristemomyces frigidus]|uniref:Zn(2)-C6 fungal-type domain-containing protein n=1 Tax=Meristemomyces frigidus TaxID=1508187 RepID=A0AAN7TAN8_9PEZI|nr:hypothetical protein LTR62_008658 [Meristemomyces frigidus]